MHGLQSGSWDDWASSQQHSLKITSEHIETGGAFVHPHLVTTTSSQSMSSCILHHKGYKVRRTRVRWGSLCLHKAVPTQQPGGGVNPYHKQWNQGKNAEEGEKKKNKHPLSLKTHGATCAGHYLCTPLVTLHGAWPLPLMSEPALV